MFLQRTGFASLALIVLGACATAYGPQGLKTGASIDEVTAALGEPTGRYPRPGGERVEFARGPYGKHTFMLDFDAQGRLSGWQQVLTEERFDTIRAGASRDDVLLALGHPSETSRLGFQRRTLWSYRYETPFCKWFQVGIDAQNRVVDTGYGPDPLCEDFEPSDGAK
jgi:outer membrane protein assembly factor BamE (lipoprotein component of BamABCDE complex)